MSHFVVAVLLATLAVPTLSVAGDHPANSTPKPTSFVPRSYSSNHVYGSPIGRPIVGRAKASHFKRTPKKQPRA